MNDQYNQFKESLKEMERRQEDMFRLHDLKNFSQNLDGQRQALYEASQKAKALIESLYNS
jgi:hypothetical protein